MDSLTEEELFELQHQDEIDAMDEMDVLNEMDCMNSILLFIFSNDAILSFFLFGKNLLLNKLY